MNINTVQFLKNSFLPVFSTGAHNFIAGVSNLMEAVKAAFMWTAACFQQCFLITENTNEALTENSEEVSSIKAITNLVQTSKQVMCLLAENPEKFTFDQRFEMAKKLAKTNGTEILPYLESFQLKTSHRNKFVNNYNLVIAKILIDNDDNDVALVCKHVEDNPDMYSSFGKYDLAQYILKKKGKEFVKNHVNYLSPEDKQKVLEGMNFGQSHLVAS
jgi:hypothetical protein